ncbi:MAG TPA: serine/threonine-protein kinase, partial [Methylomirabilota bacterium]|nr:serine/threonine-protein kinase [Methylomirabilota bacterium]
MSKPLCPQCREPIPEGAPDGMCPQCLFSLGVAAGAVPFSSHSGAAASRGLGALGDYELLEEIARGGMGVVFRARQVSLNRIVAVKLMVAGHFAAPAIVKRFKLEAEAAARLEHPHIVPIYEVAEHLGQPYFSMRFMEGGTLAGRIANFKSPIPNREAAQLMATVARAVHYAHERGILHRDLKPTNILLDSEGQPHLTDFGLAKLLEEDSRLTLTFAVLGTPAYMAPEQAAGKTKDLTTAGDLYSLGAVLYELLTGQPPFSGKTPAEVMHQVVDTEPTPPRKLNPALDEDLETICLKCLEKEPSRRYPSALTLAEELERWLRHEPIQARPSTAWEQSAKWVRRRPGIASLVALVIVLLVGGVAGTAWQAVRATRHAQAETRLRHHAESNEFHLRHTVYAADLTLAAQALERGDDETARLILQPHSGSNSSPDLRGWEWRHLSLRAEGDPSRAITDHTNIVTAIGWLGGGKRLLSA